MSQVTEELWALQDVGYGDFHQRVLGGYDREKIIGVRTPALRQLAKRIAGEAYIDSFLQDLPHHYYEENNIHGELLKRKFTEYAEYMERVEAFLPYVDNWATCDTMAPKKLFQKHPVEVYEKIKEWIRSDHVYTVRFAIVNLLDCFLDVNFAEEQLELVAGVRSEEYYIKMAVAWYFSFAVIKQYDAAVKYLEDGRLEKWTHNKAIQKCVESFRVSEERKQYLKSLRMK